MEHCNGKKPLVAAMMMVQIPFSRRTITVSLLPDIQNPATVMFPEFTESWITGLLKLIPPAILSGKNLWVGARMMWLTTSNKHPMEVMQFQDTLNPMMEMFQEIMADVIFGS